VNKFLISECVLLVIGLIIVCFSNETANLNYFCLPGYLMSDVIAL